MASKARKPGFWALAFGGLCAASIGFSSQGIVRDWLLAPAAFDRARLAVTVDAQSAALVPRSALRAFYSGHSLSDHVPEEVARIAASKGQAFEFEVESQPGSLIRARLAARREGNFPGSGVSYEVQVVTERHDLVYAARFEDTTRLLRQMHDQLVAGNADARTFFYQTWLEIDFDRPEQFVAYERDALIFWECVASAVNYGLVADGRPSQVRTLPGGSALAELIEKLLRDEVEGAPGLTARERVRALFDDRVHPSLATRYYLGAVHYATLFGSSPADAAVPPGLDPRFGRALQRLAWQAVSAYAPEAHARATRDRATCRDFASQVMCSAVAAHPRTGSPPHPLRLWLRKRRCQAAFADVTRADNPFR